MRDITSDYLMAALRQAIKMKKKTYGEVANRINTPLSTFKRHLYSSNITLDKLLEYCREIDCSLDELQKIAEQLKREDEEYFSRSQDEVFFRFPELYDFFRELRMLKSEDAYQIMQSRHQLSDHSVHCYFSALAQLGLLKLEANNKVTLLGPLYYRFAEGSKLDERYSELMLKQTSESADCISVALSRMNVTREQLLELESMVTDWILERHTKHISSGEFDISNFSDVILVTAPHKTVTFADEIGELSDDFLIEVDNTLNQFVKPSSTV